MARRRRHSRKFARHESVISKVVLPSSFFASFINQVNAKDLSTSGTYNNLDTMGKAKWQIGNAVGRVTGFYPFADVTGTHPFAINLLGPVNKWTGLGVVMSMILPAVPKLPHKGMIRKAGSGFLLGGIIGGLFDNPPPQTSSSGPDAGSSAFNYSLNSGASGKAGSGLSSYMR